MVGTGQMEKQECPGRRLTRRERQLLRDFKLDADLNVVRVSNGKVVSPVCDDRGYQSVKTAAGKDGGERFQVRLHRLKFLLLHGYLPPEVDHKDTDASNSAADNLRAATRSQNAMNRNRQSNALKYRGVRNHGRKWVAQLTIEGVACRLGTYPSAEHAHAVVEAIAEMEHGEFYRAHS